MPATAAKLPHPTFKPGSSCQAISAPARVVRPSWVRQLELFEWRADGPKPSAPACNVVKFAPRTAVIGVRVPIDLAEWIDREASRHFMSRSHYCLRVFAQYALDQGNEPREQRLQRRSA